MKIEITNHAKIRLMERGIDSWDAKEVVKSPSWKKQQSDGSMAVRKEINNRLIEVIYVIEGHKSVIKTAYFI